MVKCEFINFFCVDMITQNKKAVEDRRLVVNAD